MTRIATLDANRCKTEHCQEMCVRYCPKVRSKVEAIRIEDKKAVISEELCVGCGICVKKCPNQAITIINLPDELENDCSHRFGQNSFKLFRLPTPLPGIVLGLLGKNGIGKTSTLKILSGELKPNLGEYQKPPEWSRIIQNYKGSPLQDYFQKMSQGKLRFSQKPQYVDKIPKAFSGKVGELLEKVDERKVLDKLSEQLELKHLWSRPLDVLSGGELQRVAVAATLSKDADVYLFDEPSSYLDVKQRLQVARVIRELAELQKIVVVAEHDLAIIDYLSDHICLFYGEPSVYGVVSHTHVVRVGINMYLDGFIPDENVRFRKNALTFYDKAPTVKKDNTEPLLKWGKMEKTFDKFKLSIEPGEIRRGEVIGIFGPNGIGKTTFVKVLAGVEKGLDEREFERLTVSYKPQYVTADYQGTVRELLMSLAKNKFVSTWYHSEVLTPLRMDLLMDNCVTELSGGELQKVAIAACLSRHADLFLIDEPSAYLDVEERLNVAKVIRRVVELYGITAFVVEHDVLTQDSIADKLMIFSGQAGVEGKANPPLTLRQGMNTFLKDMNVTFRRDPDSKRPRVNKEGSRTDLAQKEIGEYYYTKIGKTEDDKKGTVGPNKAK
ncbi:MAG: ribosome biogenesis/translation initiation ATPase RLI [Candidatus Bathyarchaeia archaeon]|jgi:ATP-binding cassette subfamily E protein 1